MIKMAIKDSTFPSFKQSFARISSLAFPMALSYTFSLAIFAIGLISSYLPQDTTQMAATTLIMTLANAISIIAVSPLFSMSLLASHWVGNLNKTQENNQPVEELEIKRRKIAAINKAGIWLACIVSPFAFVSLFFAKTGLVSVFHQDVVVASVVQKFMRIYAFTAPLLMLRVCFEQMMFSFAKVNAAMIMGVISFILGTLLAIAFAFGVGSFQGMGQVGIALGYLVESLLITAAYGLYLGFYKELRFFYFFKLFEGLQQTTQAVKDIFRVGTPISFAIVNEMIFTFILSILAGLISVNALASLNFAMQFVFFMFILLSAFGQANGQEVSRELGAKKERSAKILAKHGLLTTLIFIGPLCFFMAVYPDCLLFVSGDAVNEEVHHMVKLLLPIVALAVFLDAARYNILQILRACHDHVFSTILSTVSLWFGVLCALVLGLFTSLGVYGVSLGYLFGIAVGVVALLMRWLPKTQFSQSIVRG